MIVSKTTVNNTTVNPNNNGVTFTDKPVESQIPVSAALGMVGAGLVFGIATKRKNKSR